jgi:hypothetical protein
MKEVISLVEIERSDRLPMPQSYKPFIWQFPLYVTGRIELEFIQESDNHNPLVVSNVIIDRVTYEKYETIEILESLTPDEGGWYFNGVVIFIRFPERIWPWVIYSRRHGILEGYTNGSPMVVNNILYRPGLITLPVIDHSADAFTYDKMKFDSANIDIDNTNGQFDDVGDYFGNEFNLFTIDDEENDQHKNTVKLIEKSVDEREITHGQTDELIVLINEKKQPEPKMLAQYYIANILVKLDKATFVLKDKRERMSSNIPNRKFTKKEFPFLDDNLIDRDMQEVYGHCFGVPGVCIHGKQLSADGSSINKVQQYTFRFSSEITHVERIRVKMTARDLHVPGQGMVRFDGWTTVYQEKSPEWEGSSGWRPGIIPGNIIPGNISKPLLDKGEITLHYALAKQSGNHDSSMNEVRIDGIFKKQSTPLEIIEDIIRNYTDIPYDAMRFNLKELKKELKPLDHKIGIMFDKQISIFEAIEKLQAGSVLGFKFHVHNNLFTARLDNPNRKEIAQIRDVEILNLHEIEIDWNAELYGTYTDIEYRFDYGENAGRHLIDDSEQRNLLDLHRVDKVWEARTLLAEEGAARERSDLMLHEFKELRPLIKNIQLHGRKWFEILRVYDIVKIDFRLIEEKYPRHLKKLIERKFAGEVRCQILRVVKDTNTGTTTIDVRVREGKWAA